MLDVPRADTHTQHFNVTESRGSNRKASRLFVAFHLRHMSAGSKMRRRQASENRVSSIYLGADRMAPLDYIGDMQVNRRIIADGYIDDDEIGLRLDNEKRMMRFSRAMRHQI